jgi:uncharacterized protein YqgV (UPF0045/DUF77 family)
MEEKKFEFKFSFAEIVKIVKGLQELPFKESSPVINYINEVYVQQQKELEMKSKQEQETLE